MVTLASNGLPCKDNTRKGIAKLNFSILRGVNQGGVQMNNLIVNNEEKVSKIILSTANALNKFIDELGLSGSLKVVIIEEKINGAGNKIPKSIYENRRRNSQLSKVETSQHIDDIHKMLLDGVKYEDISLFLKSKGESIGKSSIGRYAQRYFKAIESNKPPMRGGAF